MLYRFGSTSPGGGRRAAADSQADRYRRARSQDRLLLAEAQGLSASSALNERYVCLPKKQILKKKCTAYFVFFKPRYFEEKGARSRSLDNLLKGEVNKKII